MAQHVQRWLRCICSYKKSWHIVALIFTALVYGAALAEVDGSRSFTSAAWQQILDNFYPEGASMAMRLAEREVIPNWDVTLQADDVTKALNGFQTFCWFKHGMDDHLPYFWTCDIRDVKAGFSEDQPLDPNMNCSADFVAAHILHGDDPRCVPWGENSLPALSLNVDPMFDEYEIHESSPMLAPVQETLSDVVQRLASIEAHLNIRTAAAAKPDDCGAIAQGCERKPNATVTLPEDFPCACFDPSGAPFSSCRNHHWGLLQLCQPSHLHVSFLISHKVPTRLRGRPDTLVEWFLVEMEFKRLTSITDEGSGLYRSRLQLHEERFLDSPLTGSFVMDSLVAVFALMALIWFVGQSLGSFLLFLPRNFWALLALRKDEQNMPRLIPLPDFKDHLTHCLVGKAARVEYVNHFEAVMEIIVSLFMLSGIGRSIFNGGGHCTIQNCRNHSGFQRFVAETYVLFFDDDFCHGTAWIMLYVTIVFASLSMLDRTRWLPSVILLCAARIGYFLLAYGLLLCGDGIVMYIAFGPRFAQFSSPARSCSELFFLTCGMPMAVLDGIHPFQDPHSTEVAFALALYCLFMSVIGLNFFTTIILDAYNQARDVHSADMQLQRMGDDLCYGLMQLVGMETEGNQAFSADPSSSPSASDLLSDAGEAEVQQALVASGS